MNDGIWKPRKVILYRLSLHAIRLSPNSSICCLKCFWKYGEITNSNFVKSHLNNALWYYCIKLKWTVWCLLYLKSSISGVRSWISLEESQNAADPAELIGALLPMDVPTAENINKSFGSECKNLFSFKWQGFDHVEMDKNYIITSPKTYPLQKWKYIILPEALLAFDWEEDIVIAPWVSWSISFMSLEWFLLLSHFLYSMKNERWRIRWGAEITHEEKVIINDIKEKGKCMNYTTTVCSNYKCKLLDAY